MTSNTIRRVHKIDDQTLYEVLDELRTEFSEHEPTCNFEIVQGIRTTFEEIASKSELAGRYAFSNANFSVSLPNSANFTLQFFRAVTEGGQRVASASFDEFHMSFGREIASWQDKIEIVTKVLAIVGSVDLPDTSLHSPASEERDTLRQLLVGFGSTHKQMLASLNEAIGGLEKKRSDYQTEFEKREAERLEEQTAALEKLDEERKKLALQSHMSERRGLLKAMTDQTAAEIRKSRMPRGAVISRWGVFFAALILSGTSAFLAFTSISQFQALDASIVGMVSQLPDQTDAQEVKLLVEKSVSPTNWYLIIRSVLSSLVALAALVFAANWLRGFYYAEVEAAREIDQYNYDLTRASWVIETILEVQHEKKGEVPDAWIEGVTRGLFDKGNSTEGGDQGSQALRALLGYTAAASFGPDGPKLELKQKQLRKLTKDTAPEG